jgi:hypothetical protein
MGRAVTIVCVLAWACGGGSSTHVDGNTGDGVPTGDGSSGSGGSWSIVKGPPATLFTIEDFNINRYVDPTDDGDADEVGERTTFYAGPDNAYTLLPLDQNTVLRLRAGSAAALMLHDLDGNGDTTGSNEVTTWWHGALPGGGTASYLFDATRGSDGTVHVLDSATTSSIYALKDLNQDGDVDDAGEVTLEASFGSSIQPGPMTQDPSGDLWFIDQSTKDVVRVRSGTATTIAAGSFIQTTLDATLSNTLVALPSGSLVLAGFFTQQPIGQDGFLAAVRDADANGTIDASEIAVIWTEKDSDYPCLIIDLRGLADGSLLAAGDTRVCRFVDGNQNGTFADQGEVHMTYDRAFAKQYGQTQDQSAIDYVVGSTL